MDIDFREFYIHSVAPERRGCDDHPYHQQLSPYVSSPVGWFTGQNERHLLTSRVFHQTSGPLHCREAAARPALARANLFQLWTQDYERQKRYKRQNHERCRQKSGARDHHHCNWPGASRHSGLCDRHKDQRCHSSIRPIIATSLRHQVYSC